MKKNIVQSLVLITLIAPFSLMADTQAKEVSKQTIPVVYIDSSSAAGKAMLKGEYQAKADLLKTAERAKEDKKVALERAREDRPPEPIKEIGKPQVVVNSCDINTMKIAIAKLINRLDSIDARGNSNKAEIDYLRNELAKLKASAPVSSDGAILAGVIHNGNKNAESAALKDKNQSFNKEGKVECVKYTTVEIDKKKIRESYYHFPKLKSFKTAEKGVGIFEYPVLSEKAKGVMPIGKTFKADKYTAAGWVHAKGYGWVKGYKLYPSIKYNKAVMKKWANKDSAYVTVEKEDCNIVK